LGYIRRSRARIQQIQNGASTGRTGYKFYLDPIQVLDNTLPSYGFAGSWHIVQPHQPSPTPTVAPRPYVTRLGIPAMKMVVGYQEHTYEVVLEQLATKGRSGVWLIWRLGPQLT
jgi:hypothetical protein